MRMTLFPGWATSPAIFQPLTRELEGVDAEVIDFGFFHLKQECGTNIQRTISNIKPSSGTITSTGNNSVLLGCSMGGLHAIHTAVHDSGAQALILISTFARFLEDDDWIGQSLESFESLRTAVRQSPEAALRVFYRNLASPTRLRLKTPGIPDKERLLEGLELLRTSDVRHLLTDVRVPTLILHGAEDAVVPFACAERMAKAIPGARLERFEGEGHGLVFTSATKCASAINKFLSAHGTSQVVSIK